MAIKTFANDTARDIFLGENTSAARKIARNAWRSAQTKMMLLNSATKLSQVAQVPGLRFEPLKYNRPGYFSIRVNDQYRVIFMWMQEPAVVEAPEGSKKYKKQQQSAPKETIGHAYNVSIEDPKHHQP